MRRSMCPDVIKFSLVNTSTFLLLRRATALLFSLLLCFFLSSNASATCGDACDINTSCSGGGCGVCLEGFCTNCSAIGDSTNCADSGTGADVACNWSGSSCDNVPSVPELPSSRHRIWILALGILGSLWLLNRKFQNRPGLK